MGREKVGFDVVGGLKLGTEVKPFIIAAPNAIDGGITGNNCGALD